MPSTEPGPVERSRLYLADEAARLAPLLARARPTPGERARTLAIAQELVTRVRARRHGGGLDAFLHQYALTTREGVLLMCLAEALLRVPDAGTADRLIRDKIEQADWERHLGRSPSLFVNASTWGLMLTGRVVELGHLPGDWAASLGRLVARSGEPVIRQAMTVAMRILGGQFVLGRSIDEALARAAPWRARGGCCSFDMLGEAALTAADAERYLDAYRTAIAAVGAAADPGTHLLARDSVSVKLSALHPRFEPAQRLRLRAGLLPRLVALAQAARNVGIGLTLDAEEADRLEPQLELLEAAYAAPELAGWNGLGLAVQAYGKRAPAVIEALRQLARARRCRIPVRLVKGAYWDTEIKRAQEQGLEGYPVYTRKVATDVAYLACARDLFADPQAFFPMFATHNAHTLAAVLAMAPAGADFEFQRLHGMGEALYEELAGVAGQDIACRVYAPVGAHEDLLAYLVRRLLENGANTSFVNRLADDAAPVDTLLADPAEVLAALGAGPNPRIPLPAALFADRRNARGVLLADPVRATDFLADVRAALATPLAACPLVGGEAREGPSAPVTDPADRRRIAGTVVTATPGQVAEAVARAGAAQRAWDALGGPARAAILEQAADRFERETPLFVGLCAREAGKTVANGLADLREAVDFLRYYAAAARTGFAGPHALPGPTGERNELTLHGRGVFACISPWNFPVAIFTGQVAAALAAGNTVVAKPAEQTPLTAWVATRLLHAAGVPGDVLHLVPGDGPGVGAALVGEARLAGVAFTGSTEVARTIHRRLAGRDGPIATLVAETGGINAMIADSTALPEQLVRDVVASAFDSAGQRCSALRVLFVQEDIAPRVLELLAGAMAELVLGDPLDLATDIGPVIDAGALARLQAHAARMTREGRLLARTGLPAACDHGSFFAPVAWEIDAIDRLPGEVFGPALHVVRYAASHLAGVCAAIENTGYGLTLGVHSRIEETVAFVRAHVRVGNLYVNRNQIGAVVGAQPFGGEGLSGTGPKAGGPHYLQRFAVERVACVNTAAAGGNAALFAMDAPGDA
ncbi:MAG: bifunctional proline dehydrogenase/L-glutamate gamma-semialdehyde dehydrogenase PutA [Gammaproteobacteria bacterium]|nr:bifunctional proline dehydrogenase/L-glutamate gamma-semialdehyde dehydrogenase PutA [Gammaproteobacteria bacterium]